MESPLGKWLDITLDNISYFFIFLAITWSVIQQNPAGGFLQWGLLSLAGLSFSFFSVVLSLRFQERISRQIPESRYHWSHHMINKVISMMANRDFSIIVLIFALANILPWLLILVGVGSNLFGLFLLGLYLTARCRQNTARKETGIKKESPQT